MLLKLSEYYKIMYHALKSGDVENQAMLVINLFHYSGSDHFDYPVRKADRTTEVQVKAKRYFRVGHLPSTIKATFPLGVKVDELADFIERHLNSIEYLSAWIDDPKGKEKRALCYAVSKQFELFINRTEDEVENIVQHEYDRYIEKHEASAEPEVTNVFDNEFFSGAEDRQQVINVSGNHYMVNNGSGIQALVIGKVINGEDR